MRAILVFGILFLIIICFTMPISWMWVGSSIPTLESEYDLERYLKQQIEGDRMLAQSMMVVRNKPVAYQHPDFAKYPRDLVALYIASYSCPTFFQTPRETGLAWSKRVFVGHVFHASGRGDGACEWQFANNLAWAINLRGGLKQTIAASRIHSFLKKDQLVAYNLSSLFFETGVIGVDDAVATLAHRGLETFKLEELAELTLAMPPQGFYMEIKQCKNASLLRQFRDFILVGMANTGLIAADRAKAAQAQPLSCIRRWAPQ